jgi:hypothetical protein
MPTKMRTVVIKQFEPPAHRRRRLRLSVRTLMLLIVASACGLGWLVSQARQQQLAVQAIVARGGTLEYD